MSTINIKLYDFARTKLNLSETDAKEFIETIQEVVKEDIKAATSDYKSLWKEDFHTLDKRIIESKNDTIKWIFGFFVAIALLIIGMYLKK